MPRLRVSRAVGPQVLPEDRIPLDRLERDTFPPGLRRARSIRTPVVRLSPFISPVILTLNQPTPPRIPRPPQPREVRAPSDTLVPEIHHERAGAVAPARHAPRPVVVVRVVARGVVPLRPHALDVQVRAPALEGARAGLEAPDRGRAGEQGAVGEAARGVHDRGGAVVED